MADCEFMHGCPYYMNIAQRKLSESEAIIKKRFCSVDSSQCCLHRVIKFCGRNRLPADLLPDQFERTEQLILDEKQRRKAKY